MSNTHLTAKKLLRIDYGFVNNPKGSLALAALSIFPEAIINYLERAYKCCVVEGSLERFKNVYRRDPAL